MFDPERFTFKRWLWASSAVYSRCKPLRIGLHHPSSFIFHLSSFIFRRLKYIIMCSEKNAILREIAENFDCG
jgi:hypothetical protein